MGAVLATTPAKRRSISLSLQGVVSDFKLGCEIWQSISRCLRRYGLREYGPSTQGSKRCSLLRDRDSNHIHPVSNLAMNYL